MDAKFHPAIRAINPLILRDFALCWNRTVL